MCTMAALGVPYEKAQWREVQARCPAASRSGSCSRRCCAAPTRCCCSTSPTTTSTCPASAGSRNSCWRRPKTVLFVSHDRELLAAAAKSIVSVEPAPGGCDAWVHGGGFATFHEARDQRFERFEELRRRWDEKHAQLKKLVVDMRADTPSAATRWPRGYAAAQTRLRKFEEAGPPPEPPPQAEHHDAAARRPHRHARHHLQGPRADRADEAVRPRGLLRRAGRGARLQRVRQVALPAAAGRRGRRAHRGTGSSARASCRATSPRPTRIPELLGRDARRHPVGHDHAHGPRAGDGRAAPLRARPRRATSCSSGSRAGSRRGSRSCCSSWRARPRCCSTSRPTTSTWRRPRPCSRPGVLRGHVLAVTHDRGSPATFDRFLVFGADGAVRETAEPVWDERRVERAR